MPAAHAQRSAVMRKSGRHATRPPGRTGLGLGYSLGEARDMTIVTKVAALLVAVRRQDIERLSPAERQRLADLCRHVAAMAEPPPVAASKTVAFCDFGTG